MNLRVKMLITLTSLWAIASLVIIFYSKYTLSEDYILLEQKQIMRSTDLYRHIIENELNVLRQKNADWAQWDDTYHFIETKNPNYISANFTPTAFKNININLMLFFKPDGTLFYGLHYDSKQDKFIPLTDDLLKLITTHKAYIYQEENSHGVSGILRFDGQFLVLSSMPILNSQGEGPTHGTMALGMFMSDKDFANLSEIKNIEATFYPLPLEKPDNQLLNAYTSLQIGSGNSIIPLSKTKVVSYTLVNNPEKTPIGILKLTLSRDLIQQAVQTITRYISIIITIGIVFLVAVWYLLKILVLDRVASTNQKITEIKTSGEFAKRLITDGDDEIDALSNNLNDLLNIIEIAQGQLRFKLNIRSDELQRLALLNKKLYNEINQENETESKLKENEETLKRLAYYDSLTGLPNRLFFHEMAHRLLLKAQRDGTGIALLSIDANKFKQINDLYGETVGELYIKETAERLRTLIQASDVVARIAGDEFFVCLTNVRGRENLKKTLDPILASLAKPHVSEGLSLTSTFSIGVSLFPEHGETISSLERHADLALHQAQQQDGNSFCIYQAVRAHE